MTTELRTAPTRAARTGSDRPPARSRVTRAEARPPGDAPPHPPGPRRPRRYRSVWISDVHLGTRACKAELLLDFLRGHECETLYLVGDVVDGWKLRKGWYWPEEHNRVLRELLRKSAAGTRVLYVAGNHDEFLRGFPGLTLGGVRVVDELVHETADGRRLLVLHGDAFDLTTRNARWLAHLGDHAYSLCLVLNRWFNQARRLCGRPYWSLAAWIKQRVKGAVAYVESFERAVLEHARERGVDGVVCGHIHQAALREEDGVTYYNDGDWVESCTALVEHLDGRMELLHHRVPAAGSAPAHEHVEAVPATLGA